jgi:hypothetical protein
MEKAATARKIPIAINLMPASYFPRREKQPNSPITGKIVGPHFQTLEISVPLRLPGQRIWR